jgi:N-carbamoyl-L-amino-acid hydrolase
MTISRTLAERMFAALASGTADPPGVTRAAYGAGEQFAHDLARAEAGALGCETATDAAGNLFMTLPGADRARPCLMLGSHLDSVPHGGNFDGAAGVVAGLALVADLAGRGVTPARDITIAAFRAEEAAWFPLSYPGSYAALGRLDPALLAARRSDTGRTLAQHMAEAGFDPGTVARGAALFAPGRIGTFIEVHIEQGPALIGAGVPVGLVTAINGGFRHMEARARGAWAHSGATPRRYRRDAVLALADLAGMLEGAWDRIEAGGRSATITFGMVATDPAMHGGSRVAGEVAFALDIRSEFPQVLDGLRADLVRFGADIRDSRGVTLDFGPEFTWPVAAMSGDVLDRLEAAAAAAGVPAMRMPSGAGHDTAVLAEAGVPAAMLFVRNAHGSHNPDEAMELSDLDRAVAILSALVRAELDPPAAP